MINAPGDLINNTHNIKTIIDEDDDKGFKFNKLEKYEFNVQSALSKQVEIDATKILEK